MSALPVTAAQAPSDPAEVARLGMWVFLAGELLFFGAVGVAYAVGRHHLPAGFAAASARTDLVLGTLNTALLLASSTLIAIAAHARTCGLERTFRRCLRATAALGTAFLAVKGIEYHAEWSEGLFPGPGFHVAPEGDVPGAQLFFAWYFLVTGLHAVHLLIGVVTCLLFARRPHGDDAPASVSRVRVLALYWHFVDVVWVVLFPLIYLVAPRS